MKTLAELLAQGTITASEFAAARAYLTAFTAGKTAVIDARMRNTHRDSVRNLLLEGLPVGDAVTPAVPCHPREQNHRLRGALIKFVDAMAEES